MNHEQRLHFGGLLLVLLLAAYGLLWYGKAYQPKLIPSGIATITSPVASGITSEDSGAIKEFSSEDDLRDFLLAGGGDGAKAEFSLATGVARSAMPMAVPVAADTFGMAFAEEASFDSSAGSAGGTPDFSATNVQVEGVDEADIIKTDGDHIYALVNQDLYIIDARPAAEAEVLTKISFKNRPQDLFLSGDRLVVFGTDHDFVNRSDYHFRRYSQYTFFKVFDISDKKNPSQVRDLRMEGNYNNARMIGDYVYFLTSNYHYGIVEDEPLLPRLLSGTDEVSPEGKIYYFDLPYNSYNMTSLASINVMDDSEEVNRDVYLLEGSQTIFVSENNFYITYTKYMDDYQIEVDVMREIIEPRLSAENKQKVATIMNAESYVLNEWEKRSKVMQIFERYASTVSEAEQKTLEDQLMKRGKEKYMELADQLEQTIVHRVAIDKEHLPMALWVLSLAV